MSANSRFTVAIHILSWMALVARMGQAVVTSDKIAVSVNTNPVVIRRALGQLRAGGLVEARRGNGAGWSLTRPATAISLLDVYAAVERDGVFGLHSAEPNQGCPIGRGIRPTLGRVYADVEDAMRRRLAVTTVEDVLNDTLTTD
ncbi:Rrf2 family transcriptional regulator [Spirillospora sp. CA-294931]|uniref:Rrf2 family transcriptional regulator n=1 Tax=Spirillospora sp. CA-294931 TaxID=3240042 RepID=UPI003D8E89CF